MGYVDNVRVAGNGESSFLVGAAFNTIEESLYSCWVAGGRPTSVNKIGSPTHPSGTDWTPPGYEDDTGYVAGSAHVATIGGGYDNICNQIAGTIAGGGHNFIKYNAGGHSVIGGGSYNVVGSNRGFIGGGRANACTGTGEYHAIWTGQDNVVQNCNYGIILNGNDNEVSGDRATAWGDTNAVSGDDSLSFGRDNVVTHVSCAMFGEDALSMADRSFGFARNAFREQGDNQVFSTLQSNVTSSASVTNLGNAFTFPAGKIVALTGRVSVVAMLDGSADGNNDSVYTSSHWAGDVGIRWDGTNGIFHNLAGSTALTTSPNQLLPVIQDPLSVGQGPRFRINGGSLRMDVGGLADKRIIWVARYDFVQALVS